MPPHGSGDAGQSTLTTESDEPTPEPTADAGGEIPNLTTLAPLDLRATDGLRCPWCLAGEQHYEDVRDDAARCGHCDASIPTDADWYLRGEVICL